jgi:hypothetical protein
MAYRAALRASRLSFLLCVLSAGWLATSGLWAEPKPGEWPEFRGQGRSANVQGVGLAETWPEEGPKILWKMEIGEGFSGIAVAADEARGILLRIASKGGGNCRRRKCGPAATSSAGANFLSLVHVNLRT